MNIAEIICADAANGTGIRLSIFVSGCLNPCKGCFQPETWDFHYGKPFTPEIEEFIVAELSKPYYEGLTILGGEPFEPENQPVLAELLEEIRRTFPDKSIWCYSGYLFDKDMVPGGKIYTPCTDRMLSCIDVLVDGEFIQELKNLSLQFRGSSNQRILHLKDGKLIKEGL